MNVKIHSVSVYVYMHVCMSAEDNLWYPSSGAVSLACLLEKSSKTGKLTRLARTKT